MTIRALTMACAIFALLFCALPSKAEVEVSFGARFSELNDYGEWVHVDGVGRVWRPDADDDWRPFKYGHWVYSNDGWMWNSDEPFGWIVCHYGYWYNDEEQGWVWVPGYDWSPARVEWYVTDDEIGWAPMFPPGHHHRFARTHWMFCPTPFFGSIELRDHVSIRPHPERSEIRVRVYAGAPKFEFIRHHSHDDIVRVTPHRVRVEDGGHAFFRVEFGEHERPRADVVVHVGPKFRRGAERVEVQPERHVEVRHEEPERHEVRVQHEDRRVIVEPRREQREDRSEARVRVEVKSKRDNDNNNNDNNDNNGDQRRRVRVQQRD